MPDPEVIDGRVNGIRVPEIGDPVNLPLDIQRMAEDVGEVAQTLATEAGAAAAVGYASSLDAVKVKTALESDGAVQGVLSASTVDITTDEAGAVVAFNDSRFAVRPATVDQLPSLSYWAHSGYGAVAVPNSIEGCDIAYAQGADVIDFDLCLAGDDTLLVFHGPDMGTSVTFVGRTSADLAEQFTSYSWRFEQFDTTGRPGWSTMVQRPGTFNDLLTRYGNKRVLSGEIKLRAYEADAGIASGIRAAEVARDAILAAGCRDSVIIQSFSLAVLAPLIAAGIPTLLLINNESIDPVTWVAAGVQWMGIYYAAASIQTKITQAKAAGLKVMLWTPNRYTDLTGLTGYDAIDSDEWAYLSGRRAASTLFKGQMFTAGMFRDTNAFDRGVFASGRWGRTESSNQWHGNANGNISGTPSGGLPAGKKLRVTLRIDAIASGDTTRWGGIFFLDSDTAWANGATADRNGVGILIRANGQISPYKYTSGIAAVQQTSPTQLDFNDVALLKAEEVTLDITFSGSTLTIVRVDAAAVSQKPLVANRTWTKTGLTPGWCIHFGNFGASVDWQAEWLAA